MLADIPRKPTFPQHIIARTIHKFQQDVFDNVIPVSAGIYSEHKLLQKLQAIPKPTLTNYQDVIFYQTVQPALHPCTRDTCPRCGEQFGNKKRTPRQCQFCGTWNCSECICGRQRYHPRAKDSKSQLYDICHECDDKFLNLTLNHPFVEAKCLLDQVIRRVRAEKDYVQRQCQQRENEAEYGKKQRHKNTFKISQLNKDGVDLRKAIIRLQEERQQTQMRLRIKEKYLGLLMKKKQRLKQEQLDKQLQQTQCLQENQSQLTQGRVSARTMTQHQIFSQTIQHSISRNQFEEENDSSLYKNDEDNREHEELEQKLSKEKYFVNAPAQKEEIKSSFQPSLHSTEPTNNFWNIVQQQIDQPPSQQFIQYRQDNPLKESATRAKLEQIFKKAQPPKRQESDQDDVSETDSLSDFTINKKRAQLMHTAIQQSQRERMSMQQQISSGVPQKCSCDIY